jgi:hypothetical protein
MFPEWAGGRVKQDPIAVFTKEKLMSLEAPATMRA